MGRRRTGKTKKEEDRTRRRNKRTNKSRRRKEEDAPNKKDARKLRRGQSGAERGTNQMHAMYSSK